ncbi:uncharacterized protein LOC117980779 [Pan paniscus]|uniref:uncharacterized protein LOC117980779 n=1 Tax=Pan paniscus TaxID=9597 RepID=UPI00300540D9
MSSSRTLDAGPQGQAPCSVGSSPLPAHWTQVLKSRRPALWVHLRFPHTGHRSSRAGALLRGFTSASRTLDAGPQEQAPCSVGSSPPPAHWTQVLKGRRPPVWVHVLLPHTGRRSSRAGALLRGFISASRTLDAGPQEQAPCSVGSSPLPAHWTQVLKGRRPAPWVHLRLPHTGHRSSRAGALLCGFTSTSHALDAGPQRHTHVRILPTRFTAHARILPTRLTAHARILPTRLTAHARILPTRLTAHARILPTRLTAHARILPTRLTAHARILPTRLTAHARILPTRLAAHARILPTRLAAHARILPTRLAAHARILPTRLAAHARILPTRLAAHARILPTRLAAHARILPTRLAAHARILPTRLAAHARILPTRLAAHARILPTRLAAHATVFFFPVT